MTDIELINVVKELTKSGVGFPLLFWAAWLIKRYIVNGNVNRYFEVKKKESELIELVIEKLDKLIDYHETTKESESKEKPMKRGLVWRVFGRTG